MENQDELSNPELVTLAAFNLGGALSPVELEDLAIEAFELAPRRFSWKKYVDKIDLRIVIYSVQDATKPDVGYLKGGARHGYMLTEAGLKWISELEKNEVYTKSSRKLSTADLIEKEKLRLQRTNAYRKFVSGKSDDITLIDFREFTRVNDYFPRHLQEQRYSKLQNVSDEDETLGSLWAFLKKKFLSLGE